MALAPGYIVSHLVGGHLHSCCLDGFLAASLSTTTDIFRRKSIESSRTGLHFENYIQAWGSGGVATFFMNSMLIFPDIMFPADPDLCAGSICTGEISHLLGNKIIQTSFVSAMGIPITMIVLPLFSSRCQSWNLEQCMLLAK